MKKDQKRVLTASLLFLALSLSAASCGGGGTTPENTEKTSKDIGGSNTETEKVYEKDALPEIDFEECEINVLAPVEHKVRYYIADEDAEETLGIAVYELNREVEERFNVRFEFDVVNGYNAGKEDVRIKLSDSVYAGDCTYDLFMGNSVYVIDNILSNLFANLAESEYIDFSAPWWYQYINKNNTYHDKLYMGAGAFGLDTLASTFVTLYNKELAQSYDIPDLYAIVKDGNWTYDEMMTQAKKAARELNGDGILDENDQYGIVDAGAQSLHYFSYALGFQITQTDQNGTPVLTGTTQHISDIMDRLEILLNGSDFFYPDGNPGAMFTGGKALFLVHALSTLETPEIRDSMDFGIIPLPKFDREQERYISTTTPEIVGIPFVVEDQEMSEIMLEALNSTAYRKTLPAFYETVLKDKLTRDKESPEMLDIIRENLLVDFGLSYTFSIDPRMFQIHNVLYTEKYTTWYAANEKAIEAKLADLLSTIDGLL